MGTSNDEYARFLAYGNQLVEVHVQLRDLLDDLREGVVPEKDFAAHCLMFCAAVTRHHTGEDREVFPVLAQRHPELRSFLDSLVRDHEVIAGILDRIKAHAEGRAGEGRPGEGRPGEGRPGEGRTGEGHVGKGRTGEDAAGEEPAGKDRAGKDRAGEDRAGRGATGGGGLRKDSTGEGGGRGGGLGGGGVGGDGAREDLDGLAAVLETHFIGEEKRLVGVLNALHTSVGLTPLTDAVGS